MQRTESNFSASDGLKLRLYSWLPDVQPRAIIHIAHGMGEHAARYDRVAARLAAEGYAVFANDHRGHGHTAEVLGRFGPDGWNRAIQDLRELIDSHGDCYPRKPRILFGHSMGAMLTQQYITLHGSTLQAAVISGSPGFASALQGFITRLVIRFERWRKGPDGDSPLLAGLLFGAANKAFEEPGSEATGFEWLSRDAAEVRKYVDDPMCGFVPTPGSLFDIFEGARQTQTDEATDAIPPALPIYLFSGDADPVHNKMKNIDRLLSSYQRHRLMVDTRFYPGGRHEMLNETNRDEVTSELIAWLGHRF